MPKGIPKNGISIRSGIINGIKTRFQKGHTPWSKGKRLSKKHRTHLSEAHLGKPRGGNPENWKHTKETKEKIGIAGKGRTPWNKGIEYPYQITVFCL